MPHLATPTKEAYTELQRAYDFFNAALFAGELPPCLITMQRKAHTYGYFSSDRWTHLSGTIRDEIALNPVHFATRSVEKVLSTLVHEMVHLWQHHFGKPSRSRYHNRQWANQMERVGLMPSTTGEPGGARTGQSVTHYILDDGPYDKASRKLLARGFHVSWHDRAQYRVEKTPYTGKLPYKTQTREKYTCPGCGLNAWAKPNIILALWRVSGCLAGQ